MDTSRKGRMTREPAVERAIWLLDVAYSRRRSDNPDGPCTDWSAAIDWSARKAAHDNYRAALDAAEADLRAARRYKRLAGLLTCSRPAVRRDALLVLAME